MRSLACSFLNKFLPIPLWCLLCFSEILLCLSCPLYNSVVLVACSGVCCSWWGCCLCWCSYFCPTSVCLFMWEEENLWWKGMAVKWPCEFLRTAKHTWFFSSIFSQSTAWLCSVAIVQLTKVQCLASLLSTAESPLYIRSSCQCFLSLCFCTLYHLKSSYFDYALHWTSNMPMT